MIKINGDIIVYCDVDDTLLMWSATNEELDKNGITVTCPGSQYLDPETNTIKTHPEWSERLLPHWKHVESLKKHKLRGHTVVVWSAGGVNWAEAAVKALNLEHIVDIVISKPTFYYDDLMPNEFMGKRYFHVKDEL